MIMETRDNSGALFKREKQSDKQPDYSGPCTVNGRAMELAAWIKEDKNGKKYMSLKFSEPRQRQNNAPQKPTTIGIDDEIPW